MWQTLREAEENAALRDPSCDTLRHAEGPLPRRLLDGLRGLGNVHLLTVLEGAPAQLHFRHRGSGETETREVPPRAAAVWMDDNLDTLTLTGRATLVLCRVGAKPTEKWFFTLDKAQSDGIEPGRDR